jgi:hypothetical protein
MKIEKKKVAGKANLSSSAKVGVASLLGMTSVFLSGCLSDAESGAPMSPAEPDSTGSTTESSSSSAIDIPLSHEHLSSSAEEALSSVLEKPSSSSRMPTSSSGGYHAFSSSIATTPSSSSEISESSSSEEAATSSSQTDESSSSVKDESSSSSSPSSSSVRAQSSSSSIIPFTHQCEMQDSTGVRVIMCHDDDWGMMASMVSTYEMSDMS